MSASTARPTAPHRLTVALLGTVFGLSLAPIAAQAAVTGSLAGSLFNIAVLPPGAALAADGSTGFLPVNTGVSYAASIITGSTGAFFLSSPTLTGVGSISYALPVTGAVNPGLATLAFNTGVGTFQASSIVSFAREPLERRLSFRLLGTFTGAGVLASFSTPLAAGFSFSLNQEGGVNAAIAAAWTLAVPPPVPPGGGGRGDPIPVPGALALFGAGLLGLGVAVRRNRRVKA